MLNERALESAAKTLDPDMWSDDAENCLDAFERKHHDKSRYLEFVTKHGDFAVARRRKIAREKAAAAVTAYLSSLSDETDRQRRGMEEILREQGERDIPFAPTDEAVERVAKHVSRWLGRSWDGLRDGSVEARGFPVFTHGQFGWVFQAGKDDMRNLARAALEAALSTTPSMETSE